MKIRATLTIQVTYSQADGTKQVRTILEQAVKEMVNRGYLTDDSPILVKEYSHDIITCELSRK